MLTLYIEDILHFYTLSPHLSILEADLIRKPTWSDTSLSIDLVRSQSRCLLLKKQVAETSWDRSQWWSLYSECHTGSGLCLSLFRIKGGAGESEEVEQLHRETGKPRDLVLECPDS